MAEIKSFPNNQDEYIGAENVMHWLHGRTSGVFGTDGVTADNTAAVKAVVDAMAVTVEDGVGWLANNKGNGIAWWIDNEAKNGAKLQLSVDVADAALPRIDRVVVSWQTTNYVARPEVIILKGTPASNPKAPALTNDSTVRQISLAAIRIPAGATALKSSMITDERLDATVCGIVTAGVSVDTSMMQAQFTGFMSLVTTEQENYAEQQKAIWDAYFEHVESGTLVPVPAAEDAGKVMTADGNGGYSLENLGGYSKREIDTMFADAADDLDDMQKSLNNDLEEAMHSVDEDKAPMYTYGTEDLTAGLSPLETGVLYFVYE